MLANVPISLIFYLKIKVIIRHIYPILHENIWSQTLLNDTLHLTVCACRYAIKIGPTFIGLCLLRCEWHVHAYLTNN